MALLLIYFVDVKCDVDPTRDHWSLLEMDSCKFVLNEEPMDYLKFEELPKIWDTGNAQHHVT